MSHLDVYEQAIKLSEDERDLLVAKLFAPPKSAPCEHTEEWVTEVNDRIAAIDRGEVELIDSEAVVAMLRDRHGIELS